NATPVKKRAFTQKIAAPSPIDTPKVQALEPPTTNHQEPPADATPAEATDDISPPSTWEEAMQQYHQVKPGIAAMLEHVLCQSFSDDVHLLLNAHQQHAITSEDRHAFEAWLQRNVIWGERTHEQGESLLERKQREANEYTRKLWRDAEADPNIQALKEALNCRLVEVKQPEVAFEACDDIPPVEED
ncbi:MAG: hypothetical protein Q9N02_10090, partial [Ghiorsea sp.]|nr:hypothetical protein [Ghiorsea sp.]